MTDSIKGEMMDQSAARLQSGFSDRIDAALRFSAAAHHEDVRKGTQIPYVMHPFHVGLILDRHGFPEDVVIAGILHDTLEDPDYGACGVRERLRLVCPELRAAPPAKADFTKAVEAYLQAKFGEGVYKAVGHVTERKYDEQGGKRAWKVRRVEQLDELASASPHACAVKAADCLHNLRSMIRDIESDGAESMRRFNGGPEGTLWFNSEVCKLVDRLLGSHHSLAAELREALREFEERLVAAIPGIGVTRQ